MTARKAESLPKVAELQPAEYLLLSVWFGLITGLGEIALQAVRKLILHRIIRLSPDIVWMTPLADVVFFAIPGLILFFVAWRGRRLVSLRIAVFIFAFLGYLSGLFMTTWFHHYAALVLAVGLAVQTARFIATRAQQFHSIVRRTTGWMIAVVVGLAIGVHGWQWLIEHRALAKLPSASSDAPNVLLIVLDTVRAQSLSVYGYARPTTPTLERLAKTGVSFERAITTAPWTLPSHAGMFTGRWHHELSCDWFTALDDTYPTLAEVLSAHGYLTAGFVANTFYCGYEHGLNRGFGHYEDYLRSPGQLVASSSLGRTLGCWNSQGPGCGLRKPLGYYELLGRKSAEDVNEDFLRWLSQRNQRPFFAFLNYFEAHAPYLPAEPFDVKFGPRKPRGNPMHLNVGIPVQERWEWTPQEIQAEMDSYDGTIAYLDFHLGLLFGELEKRGILENTLLIITSDHGEEFGEHDVMTHGNSLYLSSLHVPLLMSFPPQVPAGMSVPGPVSLRDLPATIVGVIGLENRFQFPGASLARYWYDTHETGGPAEHSLLSEVSGVSFRSEWYPISKGDMKSLVIDQYHYIRQGDGREELYDFENDPWETRNLSGSQEWRQVLERFRTSLEEITTRN